MQVAFIHRGLRLPLSPLARGMLTLYGLLLHHFTPSGLLHMSCFATLCECFLGVRPHFDLLGYFLEAVPCLTDGRLPPAAKHSSILAWGPIISTASELESWKLGWFYAPDNFFDLDDPGLPELADEPC